MTTNWFNGTGAFGPEELKEFIKDYEANGRHNYQDTIDLGDIDSGIHRFINKLTHDMSRLQDRLALTIIDIVKRKPTKHAGDCTIYSSVVNGRPEDGICTCGYGLQEMRDGDARELYSRELKEKLMCIGGGI